jgi:hypothetical protein
MRPVTTALREEAETIFSDLGYVVSTDGNEIRAERKWRVVQVTPMPEPDEPPSSGELRCFVTWEDRITALERQLRDADVEYDWAIIGVSEDDYVVSHGA